MHKSHRRRWLFLVGWEWIEAGRLGDLMDGYFGVDGDSLELWRLEGLRGVAGPGGEKYGKNRHLSKKHIHLGKLG